MTALIIYLIGVVAVFIGCYYYSLKDDDIILGDLTKTVLYSLLSWITIIFIVILITNDSLEHLFNSNKVIYRKKRKEE